MVVSVHTLFADEDFENRINNYADVLEQESVQARDKELAEMEYYKNQIEMLGDRIKKIVAIGEKALMNNILCPTNNYNSLRASKWCGERGFYCDGWSHWIGFDFLYGHFGEHRLGIINGGACGKINLFVETDGSCYGEFDDTSRKRTDPRICDMKEFVEGFDEFESKFYEFLDSRLCEKGV